jgi:hypothetical protein
VLLVVTNTHEGDIFTSPAMLTAGNTTLAEYISRLFPRMNESSIEHAVALYSNIGLSSVPEQAAEVMGDCKCCTTSFVVQVLILAQLYLFVPPFTSLMPSMA